MMKILLLLFLIMLMMIMLIIPIMIFSPRWLNAPAAMFTSPGPRWSSELELLLFTFAFTLWWSGDGFDDQVITIAKKVAKCKMGIFSSDRSSTILWTLLLSTEEEVDHYLGFTKLIIFPNVKKMLSIFSKGMWGLLCVPFFMSAGLKEGQRGIIFDGEILTKSWRW